MKKQRNQELKNIRRTGVGRPLGQAIYCIHVERGGTNSHGRVSYVRCYAKSPLYVFNPYNTFLRNYGRDC